MNQLLFDKAISLFDAVNSKDPNLTLVEGESLPSEVVYAKRLTAWIHQLDDAPSEELLLAARAAHIGRWKVLRSAYPKGLNGYLQWREDLKLMHAKTAEDILTSLGYDQETITKVTSLIKKEHGAHDADSQKLEDALCLMFLEFQFDSVAAKTEHQKMVGILQKTWEKMSAQGRSAALRLNYSSTATGLIEEAGLAEHE